MLMNRIKTAGGRAFGRMIEARQARARRIVALYARDDNQI